MKFNSIKIKSLLLSSRFSILKWDKSIPTEIVSNCIACTNKLEPICALRSSSTTVRIGFCNKCGYVGYMDRPTKTWINNYYSLSWDKDFIRSKEMMKRDVVLPKGKIKGTRRSAFLATAELKVDKDRGVCDIGSGYGQVMKNFQMSGFKKIVGVETSQHRASLVNEVFGFDVIYGDFGSIKVEDTLKKYAPFGVMFCHHVFEHVYDPASVVSSMSKLQEEGDYAVFSVPNFLGEHINYVSLYLSHLHSFGKKSMEILFNRFNYELIEDKSNTETNLLLIFRKTTNLSVRLNHEHLSKDLILKRIRNGLGLEQYKNTNLHTLRWEQRAEGGDYALAIPLSFNKFVANLNWLVKQTISYFKSRVLHRATAYHILLVQPVYKNAEFPQEIWFDDEVFMLIK